MESISNELYFCFIQHLFTIDKINLGITHSHFVHEKMRKVELFYQNTALLNSSGISSLPRQLSGRISALPVQLLG